MKISKKIILPIAAFAITGAAILTASSVSAFGRGEMKDSMIQKLSERFGLNQSELESFFEEMHTEHMQMRQAEFESRLDEAVANGEITQEQKQLILQKHEEMHSEHVNGDDLKDLSPEDRKAKMQEKHDEMQAWAQENGIDIDLLMSLRAKERGEGMRRGPAPQSENQ